MFTALRHNLVNAGTTLVSEFCSILKLGDIFGAAVNCALNILDEFTDTNGTVISAHTIAPTNDPGASWSSYHTGAGGPITIQNNKARAPKGILANQNGVLDTTRSTFTATADVNVQDNQTAGYASCGLLCRWIQFTPSSVTFGVVGYVVGTANADLAVMENNTVRASSSLGPYATGLLGAHTIELNQSPTAISGKWDGANDVNYNSAVNGTNTLAGIGIPGSLNAFPGDTDYDNFRVTA